MRAESCALVLAAVSAAASAQSPPEMREVLTRLERLERQNAELMNEVRALRQQLAARDPAAAEPAAPVAPVEERLAVQERRIEEHEQSKVASDQKLPVTLTGTLLFNAFLNGRHSGDQYPTTASLNPGPATAGASFRQTILGLKYDGPRIAGGAKVTGSLYLDLFGGSGASLNTLLRLRLASVDFAWKNTTLSAAHDKPLLAPREPESLAQLGVSPLTGAGNLWLWQPQFRFEQRFNFGDSAGLRAQLGIYQTSETGTGLPNTIAFDRARPGYQGRFELWSKIGGGRVEIAPGFHVSDTHTGLASIPSRIFSLDWIVRPTPRLDFTGAFFNGKNIGVLGGLRQGITIFPNGTLRPIEAIGGWAQISVRATGRLTFNWYAGQEDHRNADLVRGNIAKNLVYAGNFIYRLGPNVLASFEASQTRTTYLGSGTRLNPHYDIALAYLF